MGRFLCGLVMLAFIAGCGSDTQEANVPDGKPMHGPNGAETPEDAADETMTAEEKAVLEWASEIYPDQDLLAAACEKSGFVPAGDVYLCSLIAADGSSTDPSEWVISRSSDGGVSMAMPAQ